MQQNNQDTSSNPPVHPVFDMENLPWHPKSVYFWIDCREKEEEHHISVMCQECHDTKMPEIGWLWHGSKGYGPFNIICDLCEKVVHEGENDDKSFV